MKWLEITTNLPCPNQCSYCPQRKLNEVYSGTNELKLEDYKVYLANVSKDTEIHFSGFSEPLFAPESLDIIEYTAKQGYSITIYTTLVGLKDLERFKKIKFKKIRIHDIGQKIPDEMRKFNCSKVTNIVSRAGNLQTGLYQKAKGCSRFPTYEGNVMLPNGDVVLCCQDYGLKHKLGNLRNTKLNKLTREKGYDLCNYCEYAL